LDILEAIAGQRGDERGEVEFRAHFETESGAAVLHERSRFVMRGGRWLYLDGAHRDD
jgi:SEC-C motif-containing protein